MNPTIATMASRPAQLSMPNIRDKDLAKVMCEFDLIPKQTKMKIRVVNFHPLHMDGKSEPNSVTYYNWTHLYSSGVWLGVDLRMDTKRCVYIRLDYVPKIC